MQVYYLEIVTEDVDATCKGLSALHRVEFSLPEPALGGARLAKLADGGQVGVRAPLAEHDTPIVRPYLRVEDLNAAITTAEKAGAQILMRATEVPDHGRFALYTLGGHQYGLWQV
ncbi:MAG: hydroxylase [Pseudomonadota bacterium]